MDIAGFITLACVLAQSACAGRDPELPEHLKSPVLDQPVLVVASTDDALGEGCALIAYDASLTNSVVITRFAHCPAAIFAAESHRSVLVKTNAQIAVFALGTEGLTHIDLPRPTLNASHYDEALTGEAYIDTELLRDGNRLRIRALGVFEDSIGAVLGLSLPGDDTLAIGVAWNGVSWAYADSKHCNRFEHPCIVDGFEHKLNELKNPGTSQGIWTIDSASNPNVTSARSSVRLNEYDLEIARVELAFDIGGVESTVIATGEVNQDSPGISTSTVEIAVGRQTVRSAGIAACGASIYAGWILVDGCGSDSGSLYSLRSGEKLLAGLAFAAWFP